MASWDASFSRGEGGDGLPRWPHGTPPSAEEKEVKASLPRWPHGTPPSAEEKEVKASPDGLMGRLLQQRRRR